MSGTTAAAKSAEKQKLALDPKFVGRLAGTLLGICLVVALLLGAVNYVTKPIIDRMQAEKDAAAMAQVLPADSYEPVEGIQAEKVTALYRAVSSGSQAGYVVQVSSSGFGGAIGMMVGVDMDGTVTGVAVTKQSETANIGSRVVGDQSVLDRFAGMSHAAGEITVNSGANRFDGVTGATVSSKGVAAGVNAALAAAAAAQQKGGN